MFLKRPEANQRDSCYIFMVFIPYLKIAANTNKDLINNRNQVDFLNNA